MKTLGTYIYMNINFSEEVAYVKMNITKFWNDLQGFEEVDRKCVYSPKEKETLY